MTSNPLEGMRAFLEGVQSFEWQVQEQYRRVVFTSSALNNDDDLVHVHTFIYPSVDPEVLALMSLGLTNSMGTRTLTEQFWPMDSRPLICSGQGSTWNVQLRISRTDQ